METRQWYVNICQMISRVLLLVTVLLLHAGFPSILDPVAVIAAYVALGAHYNVMWLQRQGR
jgi:hypothetical protein